MRTDISPTEFLKTAIETAEYFGFRSVDSLQKDPAVKAAEGALMCVGKDIDIAVDAVDGLIAGGLSTFCNEKFHAIAGPVMFYTVTPDSARGVALSLHIYNVQKSIAEALLIHTNRAIANDLGLSEHVIHINSLGDTDSTTRFTREITTFLRKRVEQLPIETRELMKQHPLTALRHLVGVDNDLSYRAPNPLEYLSDQSRKHFRDIIEYLDMSDAVYEIDTRMLGHHECYSDTLFAIRAAEVESGEGVVSFYGGRIDEYVHRRTKKRIPAVSSVVTLESKSIPQRIPRSKNASRETYVIQLGFGPKVKTLELINELRQHNIAVTHDITNDSLSAQLRDAEARQVPYVMIMGQKEFVDGTIILRDMKARKQEALTPENAIKKLKRGARIGVSA